MEYPVTLRIVVVSPPAGVNFSLEDDKGHLVSITKSTGSNITFDFSGVVKENRRTGTPNFTGPFAQGTPSKRFLYINIGQLAGQQDSPWQRKVKIWISGFPKSLIPEPKPITWKMVKEVASDVNKVLMVRYMATNKNGEPSCATIQLVDDGWVVAQK